MSRRSSLPKVKTPTPFQFVLDELTNGLWGREVRTRRMFGSIAVYVDDKLVFIFCDREQMPHDRGIWVCIPDSYCTQMKGKYPALRGVSFFENEDSAWQCLSKDEPHFEELALEFCNLIRKGDPAIGRTPKVKNKRASKKVRARRREF